ncbi:MAG: polysulfide reductase NrfD [FCB group bacterium]|nr:polysulfide reductase NrfD [FCB group bacterium]MBL7027830.1 polysulfide reductase NrfD [Candidatus Neomarinimicrobiota bacterium]MBL7120911.1 polysulfide reductase NrfD [Candidatus Neomarinimicrobiota bacterium]
MSEHILSKDLQPKTNRWKFILGELKPKGKLLTPFNIISVPVILLGLVLIIIRFWKGLSSITNLSQEVPWGLWIGFDVVTGVAFAGGAYVLTFMVYILRMEKYHSIVRVTVLNGFLAYLFYAGALLLDLGRPWNVINPIIGNSFGTSSVLFLVAWHFMLYMLAELIEFSPAIAEWLGAERARRILKSLTIGAVIFGITLSTLHQSGLGALFLMAKGKIHPLWYSEFIPILFFVSSIFAGLSMVIFEGSITHRVFSHQLAKGSHKSHDQILRGLAKICSVAMFAYLFLKILDLVHGHHLSHLYTSWGAWYLVEIIGFVMIPMFLFIRGVKTGEPFIIKLASLMTLIGIILNRLNISVIGFNWMAVDRYIPTWMEFEVTFAVLFLEIWIFRWVLHRLPVLRPIEEVVKSQNIERS